MKTLHVLSIVFIGLVSQVNSVAQTTALTKLWETDSTLKVPESVLYYAPEKLLYVSCINGSPTEKDSNGYIAIVSQDGKIINPKWAVNLSAPKGMGMYKDNLYVTDLSEVVVINRKTGKVTKRIPVPKSVFLNDITIDAAGIVYVSDSRTGIIHRMENDKVSTWMINKDGVNGLLASGDDLYMAVKDTLYRTNSSKKLTVIATGMDQSSDGIIQNGNEFIVSCWIGIIYAISTDGKLTTLLDTRAQKSNTADLGFNPETKTLYVPTFFKNKVVAYMLR